MKKYFAFFSLIAVTVLSITSCKTEIDVTGEYKQIPVIVGVLNQSDSIQFVRVNRTFLGPGDATQIAQIPDSNYFQNVEVKITEKIAGNTREWILQDTIIEDKEPGAFYTTPNKVYFFQVNPNEPHNINSQTSQLNPDAIYRLDVSVNNGAQKYYATTELVKNFGITNPSQNTGLNLNQFQPGSTSATKPKDVGVTIAPGNATRFTCEYYFTYEEFTSSSSEMITKSYSFDEITLENAGAVTTVLRSDGVYDWLATAVLPDNNVTKRSIISGGIRVHAASEELDKYILASQPSSSIAQSKPNYSNIIEIGKDEDGVTTEFSNTAIGFFGSRNTAVYYKLNTPVDFSSRLFNAATLTKHASLGLGFCSANNQDINKTFFCP